MSATSEGGAKGPLDAAQKIVAVLEGMRVEQQLLSLKFAIETLGLKFPAMQQVVSQMPPQPNPIPPTTPPVPSANSHSSDIRSFTALKSPSSDRQFAAVVAYFYLLEAKADERKDAIDAEVMREAARLAGWPQVQRWAMTLTNAKNAGYLDAAGAGKFKLSSVGENLVAITLPGNGGSGSKKATKKKVGK